MPKHASDVVVDHSKSTPIFGKNTRREILKTIGAVTACFASGAAISSSETFAQELDLKTQPPMRNKIILELKGKLQVKKNGDITDAKSIDVPLEAKSEILFDEQVVVGPSREPFGSMLRVNSAKVENRVDGNSNAQTLRDECKQIVRIAGATELNTNCIETPLTVAERDLISGPVATLYLDELVPSGRIKKNEPWDVSNETVRRLFGYDAVFKNTVVATLTKIGDQSVSFDIKGNINASAKGVATAVKIDGKVQLDRKSSRVTWFAATLDETREVGVARPGFKVLARVRVLRKPIPELTVDSDVVGTVSGTDPEALDLVQVRSAKGHYQFLSSDNWIIIRDDGVLTSLRHVVGNRFIAQCNVFVLPDMEAGVQLTLEGFKSDIAKSMGDSFINFIQAEERLTGSGLRMLRVVSQGTSQGQPIRWINVQLSDDDGRHLNFVFTLDETVVNEFADADEQIVESVVLLERPNPTVPKTASSSKANKK